MAPFKIAITDYPHFGISMGKRDVSEAALRMFIKQSCSDARVAEKIKHDLGFHEIGGGTDFFHRPEYLRSARCALHGQFPGRSHLEGLGKILL